MRANKLFVALLAVLTLFGLISGVRPASATKPTVNIVALGDSYTAGNGAENYYGPNGCFRSHNNYSNQYANLLKQQATVNYTNLACSGAVAGDLAGQINQNRNAVNNADLIFMSIGGNDTGFASVVIKCFVLQVSDCASFVDGIKDPQLTTIVNNVENALRYVASQAPRSRIILVGYPYLISDCNAEIPLLHTNGTTKSYPIGRKLQSVQARYNQLIAQRIDTMRFVGGMNVRYANLQELYRGHEYCGSKELWLVKPLKSWPHMEYFHPNFAGHNATALSLYLQNVHAGMLTRPTPKPKPVPAPRPSGGKYTNLPFACGTTVPHVSTYDSFAGFSHGKALDMPMPSGTPVVSPAAGKVSVYFDQNGYGRYVDVLDGSGTVHRFAHLQMQVQVSDGQTIQRGTRIGTVGVTGFTTGPHLHYEWLRGGAKVDINLGASIHWGGKQDSSGFRTTTHALKSGNCGGSSGGGTARPRYSQQDVLIWERTQLRYARSGGRKYTNWEPFATGLTQPTRADSCQFDSDRFTEYVSYEKHLKQFAMGSPPENAFRWSVISSNHPHVDNFACIDWNLDGKEDIWMRNTHGDIRLGISDGNRIVRWHKLVGGIGHLSHIDACDINGDGQDEIVAYEPGMSQVMSAVRISNTTMQWRRLVPGIGKISGLACGNFVSSHRGDEMIVWQPEQNGRYVIGEFGGSYNLLHWDPLSPTGLSRPYNSDIQAGDIDADGLDELLVNEYRPSRRNHSIMVANFTAARRFEWYPFIEGITARNMEVGDFKD